MRRLLALTRKEFLQLRRDTISIRMMVMVPIMQTLIFGYAINYDVKHLRTVVQDECRTETSRDLVAKMTASGYFDVVRNVDSLDEVRHELDAGHASVALVIDRDFGKDRHRGSPAHALLIVNASDTKTASQAMSIVRERERGTLEQLQVTPVTRVSRPSPRRSAPAAACPGDPAYLPRQARLVPRDSRGPLAAPFRYDDGFDGAGGGLHRMGHRAAGRTGRAVG